MLLEFTLALAAIGLVAWNRQLRRRCADQAGELDATQAALRAATDAAARSRDEFNAALNAIPDLMFEVDLQGRYLSVHATRVDHLAAPPEALVGHTIDEFLPPEAVAICRLALREAHENGHSYGRQFSLALPAGRMWFELSIARKPALRGAPDEPQFIVLSRDVTGRRDAEDGLLRLNQLHTAMTETSLAILRCTDEQELFRAVCAAAVVDGGLSMAWIGLLDPQDRSVRPVAHHGAGADYLDGIRIVVGEDDPFGRGPTGTAMRENRPYWCQDFPNDPATAPWHERGRRVGWESAASIPLHRSGAVIGALTLYAGTKGAFDDAARKLLVGMAMNIDFALERFHHEAERARMAEAVADSEKKYRELAESVNDVIWSIDIETRRFLYVSPSVLRLRGHAAEEVISQPLETAVVAEDLDELQASLEADVADFLAGRRGSADFSVKAFRQPRKDGSEVWTETVTNIVRNGRNGRLELHGVTRDVTERRAAETRIQQLAHFDHLTGLPNRTLLKDRFDFALSLERRTGRHLAVLFLDLDHFKDVNDTHGHDVGDQLLVEIARRLKNTLRESDTVSRVGGDEFVILLPDTDPEGVVSVVTELLAVMARPAELVAHTVQTSCSIGIAMYPEDGTTRETLSKNADVAMYQAKRAGRNTFRFFTPETQANSARTSALSGALHQALERGEFHVMYQPQVSLRDGRVIGAEALLRWEHPEFGPIPPVEFIPIAERAGLIPAIGEWVLHQATAQGRRWLDEGLAELTVAVNLSAIQFRGPDLAELVCGIAAQSTLPIHLLELELTEAAAMHDPYSASRVIASLREHGVHLSIDDFGTSASSLTHLRRFKVAKLKIDRSLVAGIGTQADDESIVAAIISLAHNLGITTIAEGVETLDQSEFLQTCGCEAAQGYLFSQPLTADAFLGYARAAPGAPPEPSR